MQAFGALVGRYQDRLFNMVLRMCGSWSDAEELTQEALLKALERIGQFKGFSQFYTWLFRIAANLAISHRRRRARVRFHSMSAAGVDGEGDDPQGPMTTELARQRNPGPLAEAMAADTGRQVAAALDGLDEEFRAVLVLRDVEDMDYAQIAEVLDVAVGTVKSRLYRARAALREKLTDLVEP